MMKKRQWRVGELVWFSATNEEGGGWVVEENRCDCICLGVAIFERTKSAFSAHSDMQVRIEALLAEHKDKGTE